jgi:hypothetical protein
MKRAGIALVLLLLGGCQRVPLDPPVDNTPPKPGTPVHVRGEGKILELNYTVGAGILEVDGKRTRIYWQTQADVPSMSASARHETKQFNVGDKATPVGSIQTEIPEEDRKYKRNFPAHVGDVIIYQGLEMWGEIYVTGLEVKKAG